MDNNNLYNHQKHRFSSIQSSYHKLLNTLYYNNTIPLSSAQKNEIIKINNALDLLEAHIISFQENTCSNNPREIENITKNNLVIDLFKPIMIAYRFLID